MRVFRDLAICDRVLHRTASMKWADLKIIAENVITEFPEFINDI